MQVKIKSAPNKVGLGDLDAVLTPLNGPVNLNAGFREKNERMRLLCGAVRSADFTDYSAEDQPADA
jgi:hypothetical protein